jgi:hypothetical protein
VGIVPISLLLKIPHSNQSKPRELLGFVYDYYSTFFLVLVQAFRFSSTKVGFHFSSVKKKGTIFLGPDKKILFLVSDFVFVAN